MQLPCLSSSAGLARRRMKTFLAERVEPWDGDRAALVVSELVANAVLHGVAPIQLHVDVDGMLRIEVSDGDCFGLVHARPAETDLPGGRGLRIVDALADDWGTRVDEHGKTVWAQLQEPTSTDRAGAIAAVHDLRGRGESNERRPRERVVPFTERNIP
ncbi:MAG: hypothetical protein QOG65_2923 [Actinomycetota bacterium]|nr:hypothetical protein [Actinomycetota bacterium]